MTSELDFILNGEIPLSIVENKYPSTIEEDLHDMGTFFYEDDEDEDEDEDDDWEWTPPVREEPPYEPQEKIKLYKEILEDPDLELKPGLYEYIKDTYLKEHQDDLKGLTGDDLEAAIMGHFLDPIYSYFKYVGKSCIMTWYDYNGDIRPVMKGKKLDLAKFYDKGCTEEANYEIEIDGHVTDFWEDVINSCEFEDLLSRPDGYFDRPRYPW